MILKSRSSRRRNGFYKTRRSRVRLFVWLVPVLTVLLWAGYKQMESYFVQPKAIFVLGGATRREQFAAEFARQHPNLPIWISGGAPKQYTKGVFANAGIDTRRLHLDYRAVDTVTNFTTLVDEFQSRGIDSVYLITYDDHMRRARIIGEIVFGTRGIALVPVPIPTKRSPEPLEKSVRDAGRAILWVMTGYTGASLGQLSEENKGN